jgi:hypothetical protein
MTTKDTGGPAFPAPHFDMADTEHGMTLRDYFAAKAMQGWLASYGEDAPYESVIAHADGVATLAFAVADAMLKARKAK